MVLQKEAHTLAGTAQGALEYRSNLIAGLIFALLEGLEALGERGFAAADGGPSRYKISLPP